MAAFFSTTFITYIITNDKKTNTIRSTSILLRVYLCLYRSRNVNLYQFGHVDIHLLSAMALTILCVGNGLSYNIFDLMASVRIKLLKEIKTVNPPYPRPYQNQRGFTSTLEHQRLNQQYQCPYVHQS